MQIKVYFKGKNTEIGLRTVMFHIETNISSSPLKRTEFLLSLVLEKFIYMHTHKYGTTH